MKILRIALNDLRIALKDKTVLLWWFAMPMIFILIFGSLFRAQEQHTTWIPVFNHDPHDLSQVFIETMREEGYAIDVRSATEEQYVKNWSRARLSRHLLH